MNKLEKMLPQSFFLRVHRKFIINLSFLEAVDFNNSRLTVGSNIIPISRNKRKEVEKRINLLS
jgi:DNA-binding LytR/AlgR family response regulator